MHLLNALAIVFLVAATAPPARALTPREIDAGARHAQSGLKNITRTLTSKTLAGRDNNTPASLDTQAYLLKRLRGLADGLGPGAGDDAYRQPFVHLGQTGTNLLGVIRGRELPDEYVFVGAHYDHLGTRSQPDGSCSARGTPGGEVCPGATDNAAGVAAVLAIGHALRKLPTPPRRSVVLALWDAEEDGLVGSNYYVQNPLVPLAKTRGYVNFDDMGENLLPSLRQTSFAISAETGGSAFQAFVDDAVSSEGLGMLPVSFIFGQRRSDYASFVDNGVPSVFFTDADGACNHKTGDTAKIINAGKLKAQSRIAYRVTAALAENASTPAFVPPNPALATYADAVSLLRLSTLTLADLSLFAPPEQASLQAIQAGIAQIVADGPALFDSGDVQTSLTSALQILGAIKTLPCSKM